jgi:hypothetical protein
LQFPWFNKNQIQADEFFLRLRLFLKRIEGPPTVRFVVEISNKAWLDKRFAELLREYNVALTLTDPVEPRITSGPRGDRTGHADQVGDGTFIHNCAFSTVMAATFLCDVDHRLGRRAG